jgi:hypothetical protein
VFRETTADYENSWHRCAEPAIRDQPGGRDLDHRQRRRDPSHPRAGEVVLVEDTTGKGHITRSSGDKPRHTIFVPVD